MIHKVICPPSYSIKQLRIHRQVDMPADAYGQYVDIKIEDGMKYDLRIENAHLDRYVPSPSVLPLLPLMPAQRAILSAGRPRRYHDSRRH